MNTLLTELRDKKGLATLELALTLPFLLIVTFGMLQYGWLFFRYHQLTNVAYRAARVASLPTATSSEVQQTVQEMMKNFGMEDIDYTVTLTPEEVGGIERLELITLRVSVPYDEIAPFGAAFVPLPENLVAKVALAKNQP